MVKRIEDADQMDLFASASMYLSQAEVAEFLKLPVRVIQHWESLGLVHRELSGKGRRSKYTKQDLIELNFVKSLVYEHGYVLGTLKEKLAKLEAPYCYDPDDTIWDNAEKIWKSKSEIACSELNRIKYEFVPYMRQVLDKLPDSDDTELALNIIGMLRALVRGQRPRLVRRSAGAAGKARPRKRTGKTKKVRDSKNMDLIDFG
ncbi:MerR family transcriptional regulator [bacterium]|nr:MerR family transcriptional regulator [bacterium]